LWLAAHDEVVGFAGSYRVAAFVAFYSTRLRRQISYITIVHFAVHHFLLIMTHLVMLMMVSNKLKIAKMKGKNAAPQPVSFCVVSLNPSMAVPNSRME
jgi:hypothetical protein